MAVATPAPYELKDMQDPSNPFYIHPNENPSMVLVTPLLSETNYYDWSNTMRMPLLTKNKESFIDGTIAEPASINPIHPFWKRCNNLVRSWLYRSMTPDIAKSVISIEKASDIWTELRERFSRADLFRISELQEQQFSLR
jgi:hypothetical protein